MSFLTLTSVTRRYGPVAALDAVDLSVAAGSRTAIVGPSGSGKTTLLRIIAGFEAPDAGRVVLGGELVADGPRITPAHRRGVGVVMQDGALFPHLSIAGNIGFGLDRDTPGRTDRIAELMRLVGLDVAISDRRPDTLSGGQQQRVALARALARKPRLMLLDEPFSALDTGLRASTRKAVANLLSEAGITTILVTHDQAEALSFADQVVVMREGKLLQAGTPRELYLRPNNPMTAAFLGDAIILTARLAGGHAECILGLIPVSGPSRRGTVEILLRPEQISLSPVRPDAVVPSGAPRGQIIDVDFGGAVCTVSLLMLNEARCRTGELSLQQSRHDVPPVGSIVQVKVAGVAHVFQEADTVCHLVAGGHGNDGCDHSADGSATA